MKYELYENLTVNDVDNYMGTGMSKSGFVEMFADYCKGADVTVEDFDEHMKIFAEELSKEFKIWYKVNLENRLGG